MPDEPCSPHGWTVDTLETFLTEKIAALDRFCTTNFQQSKERVDMALSAADKAVTKAEAATEKRFDAVNEFRGAMDDQAKMMVSRAEYTVQHDAMSARVAEMGTSLTTITSGAAGKTEGIGGIGIIILGCFVGLNALMSLAAVVIELVRH